MNDSINHSTFINDLMTSDDEFEPYGLSMMPMIDASLKKKEESPAQVPLHLHEFDGYPE